MRALYTEARWNVLFFPPLLREGVAAERISTPLRENLSRIRMPKRHESRQLLPLVGAHEFALIKDVTFHDLKELVFG